GGSLPCRVVSHRAAPPEAVAAVKGFSHRRPGRGHACSRPRIVAQSSGHLHRDPIVCSRGPQRRSWFWTKVAWRRLAMKHLTFGLMLLSLVGWPAGAAETARKPNILVIVADDLGYADTGFQGCKDIPTPNLDALAKKGVRCTNGYVSGPYCSPTRAGLLTGR